jgi:hypothetical protein
LPVYIVKKLLIPAFVHSIALDLDMLVSSVVHRVYAVKV